MYCMPILFVSHRGPPPPRPPCPPTPPSTPTHPRQHLPLLHDHYMGTRRGADKKWARCKRESMLSQILNHFAPHPADLVVIGGNFDGMQAWGGCSYGTPMLKVGGSWWAPLAECLCGP